MNEIRNRDIVIYDGECKFCIRSVRTLQRIDLTRRLELISLHSPEVAKQFPDLSHEMLMDQMWVVAVDGTRYGGSDAIRYLSRRLPLLYPLAPLMHLPGTRWLWRRLYRAIAARRYKIAGRDCGEGTCHLHAAKADG